MDFFKKLMDGFKQMWSNLSSSFSNGFSNFSFAALFGIGSAQAATPPQPPQRPAVVQPQLQPQAQPQVQPGRAPTAAPTATPATAEMRTKFESTLTPEQRQLYADHNAKKNPFPARDANGQPITYAVSPDTVKQADLAAAQARDKFERSITPDQLRDHRRIERAERAEARGPEATPAQQRAAFEQGLSPEQRALYIKQQELRQSEAGTAAPAGANKIATPAAIADADFKASLTPQQQEAYRAVQQQDMRATLGNPEVIKAAPVSGRINRDSGLVETITPADPARGSNGVATVTLSEPDPAQPAAAPVAAAPVQAAPPQQAMRAPRPQVYTEAGPNGSSVQVNPAQYENNQPYMGASGPNRGSIGFMRPFQQETAERAAFNPHNPMSVQNRVADAMAGQIMARVGNNSFMAPIAAGMINAARYDMGRNVPNMNGDFRQAAGFGGVAGFGQEMGRQSVGQAIIQDGINTALTNMIPQHSNPGGAFGALLGKLGR